MIRMIKALSVFSVLYVCVVNAQASDVKPTSAPLPELRIELNGAESVDNACRLTFLMHNKLASDVSALSFELAVINKQGLVTGLLLLRSGLLPTNMERVKQFDLPQTQCDKVDRLLINTVVECVAQGVDIAECRAALKTATKIDIGLQ